ncbi:MAG: S8 family serine peptidase [Bifidobacteriaceae bacterium]|jgi:subtilisin family serine protease|nr:S8 family serine peptidase [Bifidobacteriaceae bacterium]
MRTHRAACLTAIVSLAALVWCGAGVTRAHAAGAIGSPGAAASDAEGPRLVRSAGQADAGPSVPSKAVAAVAGTAGVIVDRLVAIKRPTTSNGQVTAQVSAVPGARVAASGADLSGRVVAVEVSKGAAAATLAAMRGSGLYQAVDYDVERRAFYTASPNDPYFQAPNLVCFDPEAPTVTACRNGYLRTVDGAWGLKTVPGAGFTSAWAALDASTADVAPVAVIDTGLQDHPDLKGDNFVVGRDFVDGDSNVDPGSSGSAAYHGTAVAGLIAASTNNSVGIAGAAPDNKVVVYRAGNPSGSFSDAAIVDSVLAAVKAGVRVINCSFGGPSPSATDQAAFQEAADAGILVVAAAGNNGQGGDGSGAPANTPEYPANYPSVMSVAALESNGAPAAFGNYDSAVAIAAAGDDLAVPAARTSAGKTTYYSPLAAGTSFAAPLVAAAAADLWRVNPGLSAAQVRQILEDTAVDVDQDASEIDSHGQDQTVARAACRRVGRDDCTGAGRLNVAAAVAAAGASSVIDVARDRWTVGVTQSVSIPIQVVGGAGLRLDATLPAGMEFEAAAGGGYEIAGSTTVAGTYRLPLTLVNAAGTAVLTRTVTLVVTPGPLVAYSLVTDHAAYELDASMIYANATGRDRYGNDIPNVAADTMLRVVDASQCGWPAGQAPSHRVCTVLGVYSGQYGEATAQTTVDVFDTSTTAFAPAMAGTARVGQTLTAQGPDWPGLGFTWLAGAGAGTVVGTGASWVVSPAAVGQPVRLRATLAYKDLTVSRTSVAAGPVAPGPATAGLASQIRVATVRATGRLRVTVVPAVGTLFAGGSLRVSWGSGSKRSLARTAIGPSCEVLLPYVKPGRYRVRVTYAEGGRSAMLGEAGAAVAKYRPSIKVRVTGRQVTVTVKRGSLKATGRVVLRLGGLTVRVRLTAAAKGRAVVPRRRFGKSTGSLRAAYRGSAWFRPATGKVRVRGV